MTDNKHAPARRARATHVLVLHSGTQEPENLDGGAP